MNNQKRPVKKNINTPKVITLKIAIGIMAAILLITNLVFFIFVVALDKNITFLKTYNSAISLIGLGIITIFIATLNSTMAVGRKDKSDKYMILIALFLIGVGIIKIIMA